MIICGVVVLYNPTHETLSNIDGYIHGLHRLFVIDNSEVSGLNVDECLAKYGDQVEYCSWGENKGVASALNEGARRALQTNADWLLTMDQDSQYLPRAFASQLDALRALSEAESKTTGILSCRHLFNGRKNAEVTEPISSPHSVITSGNLVNLAAWLDVGGFREELFIDEVDNDFCQRMRRNGYAILVVNSAFMMQFVGNTQTYDLLFFKVQCSHHSYVRRYYISRNRLYVATVYPELTRAYIVRNVVSLLKILLFEEDKLRKLRAFLDGMKDHYKKRYGKKSLNY